MYYINQQYSNLKPQAKEKNEKQGKIKKKI